MRGEVLSLWEREKMDLMAPHRLAPEGLLGDAPGLAGLGTRLQARERGGKITRPTGSTGPTGNATVTLRGNHSGPRTFVDSQRRGA